MLTYRGLIEHLEDAVASKKLAVVEAVRLEFQSREDREELLRACAYRKIRQ
jgi:hypothetical protein